MKIGVPIQPIGIEKQNLNTNETAGTGLSFGDFLNNAINNVNDLQMESQKLSDAFAMGKTDNIQQVMIASEKAEMALQFTLQIRNKILDAYNEIMRMPV